MRSWPVKTSFSLPHAALAFFWSSPISGLCFTGALETNGLVRGWISFAISCSAYTASTLRKLRLSLRLLCLSPCDALEPEEIRKSIKLFPGLGGETLQASCFFEAKAKGVLNAPVSALVGNPPFESSLTTEAAMASAKDYARTYGGLADNQIAYLFLHEGMKILEPGGVLAMNEPSGFLYNQYAFGFLQTFFKNWNVRELLDFVSVRGLFKKGDADPKVAVVVSEATPPRSDSRLLHSVFRRNGRATAEQGFDIDYYDLHWVQNSDAAECRDIWRANLLGGGRVHDFIIRLRSYQLSETMRRSNSGISARSTSLGRKAFPSRRAT